MYSIALGLVVVGGSALLAILGLLIVRKRFDVRQFTTHHEVGGYMLSILGTLYAVVLGFVVVNVSDALQQARVNIATEANSMLDVVKFAAGSGWLLRWAPSRQFYGWY